MRSADLDIRLLGAPTITVDGRPLQVDTRKAVALLAYLATEGSPQRRDTLTALLWPDYGREQARGALRRTLSAIRKGLDGRWMTADRNEVRLDPGARVDCRELETIWADIESHSHALEGVCSSCLEPLRRAGELVRGEFMAGFGLRDSPEFDDWQLNRAAMYRRLAGSVLERLSLALANEGDYRAATDAALRWLELDNLHEPAHRQVMRLFAWSGDRTAALRQYRIAARTLEEELGVAPLEETSELYHDILQGKIGPAAVPSRLPPSAPPPSPTRPVQVPFVGRDAAMALISRAQARASKGLTVVAINGEPGIGKTRLAEEFLAGFPGPVVRATGHRGEAGVPFGLIIEALRAALELPGIESGLRSVPEQSLNEAARLLPEMSRLRPDLPEPPRADGPGAHARLLRGAAETLLILVEGLLFLDDLQWADTDSLDVLTVATTQLAKRPVLVLATFRDTDLPPTHPLPLLLHRAHRSGMVTTIELARLTRAEVAELAPDLEADDSDRLFRLSEGVPYFAVEYLAALRSEGRALDELPGGIRGLLADRVGGVGDLANQLLGAAAVLGRSFDFEGVRRVSGRSEDEAMEGLEELLRHGLIREDVAGFDFHHDRLRQFVYEGTSLIRRRRLHSRAADLLLSGPAKGPQAAVAAAHLEAAGRLEEAAHQHALAGDYAARVLANDQALHHYEAALSLGHPDTTGLREAIGHLLTLSGSYGAALGNLEAAAAAATGSDLARLERQMGVIYARAGEWDHSEAHLSAAADELADQPAERSLVLADWAWVAHRRGRPGRAAGLAKRALEDGIASAEPLALAQAHNMRGILARRGHPQRARRHFEQSLAIAPEGEPSMRAAALNNLALACLSAGDMEQGVAYAEEALVICRRIGDRHKQAAVHSNLADLLHSSGREKEAAEHLTLSATLFAEVGMEAGALEPEVWKLTEW